MKKREREKEKERRKKKNEETLGGTDLAGVCGRMGVTSCAGPDL